MTLKIAVLAPMPIASVSTAMPVKSGIRAEAAQHLVSIA